MKKISATCSALLIVCGIFCAPAKADSQIEVQRHAICNLFDEKEPVKFDAVLRGFATGPGKAEAVITNYFGESKTFPFAVTATADPETPLPLDLGVLESGYYELKVQVTMEGGKSAQSKMMSFGVTRLVHRTAEEALKENSRFGLKVFQIGPPGIWWRKPEVWNLADVVDGCAELGLQWTRHQFNQPASVEPGMISTEDLYTKHPMNVVLKVEGFPLECWDETRYGPLEAWKAKKKTKIWNRCTVPLKEPYQKWLKEQVAKIPESQNIFEIGNEVWEYMSAEEFAEWSKMSVEAIKQVRPQAKVGADPQSGGDYSRRFLAAGGMDNMDIWYDHPYSFTPLPEHRIRGFLRNMRDMLKAKTGRDFDLYVTEYGWSTAPQDRRKQSVSEKIQAQRTTRESLMLYAEDAKVIIPHWMGDREQDLTEREHWFGFFRLNQQPRPVLMAHAVCARMIDSSRFVGDLWYGPGIGAMLFERGGQFTLVLWTAEEDKQAEINVGVAEVTLVDLMGCEKKLPTTDGKLSVPLNGDVLYLTGVSPDLAKDVVPPTQNMNPERWVTAPAPVSVVQPKAAPKIDGDLADWAGKKNVALKPLKPDSGMATAMLGWDPAYVYLAVKVSGQTPGRTSNFQFTLRTRPDRDGDMFRLYDYVFTFGAPGAKGTPLLIENPDFDKPMKSEGDADPSGVRCVSVATVDGWTAELAIPVALLKGLSQPAAGTKLSGHFVLSDSSDKNKIVSAYGEEKPSTWPFLVLETTP